MPSGQNSPSSLSQRFMDGLRERSPLANITEWSFLPLIINHSLSCNLGKGHHDTLWLLLEACQQHNSYGCLALSAGVLARSNLEGRR